MISRKVFENFKEIYNQFSGMANKVDEEDKIAVVLEKAPNKYAGIFSNTER